MNNILNYKGYRFFQASFDPDEKGTILSVNFFDAQCGFKFAKKESVLKIIDDCKDKEWFFDTELLYKAEKNNLSICEVPVTWVDDKDSSVNLISTIINDLIGLIRLRLGK